MTHGRGKTRKGKVRALSVDHQRRHGDSGFLLHIFSLGRFGVVRDGKPLEFPGRVPQKTLVLLKVIVALGGRDVPVQRIVDILWPECDGDNAFKAFTAALHRLRKLLGTPKAVLLGAGKVSLDNRVCRVDVWELERSLGTADAAWDAAREGAGEHAVTLSEDALRLYRGPFLRGEDGDPWVAPFQERIRSKVVRCATRLGRHREDEGRYDDAIAWYRKGLEADNLSEELFRSLVSCYRRSGKTIEALAACKRFRDVVRATLGGAPSVGTLSTARDVRRI